MLILYAARLVTPRCYVELSKLILYAARLFTPRWYVGKLILYEAGLVNPFNAISNPAVTTTAASAEMHYTVACSIKKYC